MIYIYIPKWSSSMMQSDYYGVYKPSSNQCYILIDGINFG